MIRKPGLGERQGYWKADAWHAASAEPVFRWPWHGSRHPRLAKTFGIAIMAVFAVCTLIAGGPLALGFTVALVVTVALVGSGLRRVLMYLSLRRYGEWEDMPAEMRAALDTKTDLATAPAPFKPMPRGYRARVEGVPEQQKQPHAWYVVLGKILAVIVLLPLMGTLATLALDNFEMAAGIVAIAASALFVRHALRQTGQEA